MYEQGGPSMARDIALVTLAVVLLTSYALGQNKCVFLTSETTDGAITENVLTGRVAANAICERLARSAGSIIPAGAQADPWRAWLSDSTVSPINDADGDVFIKATIPYFLPDGTTKVADDYMDLTDGTGTLDAPINQDETGSGPTTAFAWTGTIFSGTASGPFCSGWSTTAASGRIGSTAGAPFLWSSFSTPTCVAPRHLYCLQQGNPATPVVLQSFTIE